jgi:hypothetical protein
VHVGKSTRPEANAGASSKFEFMSLMRLQQLMHCSPSRLLPSQHVPFDHGRLISGCDPILCCNPRNQRLNARKHTDVEAEAHRAFERMTSGFKFGTGSFSRGWHTIWQGDPQPHPSSAARKPPLHSASCLIASRQ